MAIQTAFVTLLPAPHTVSSDAGVPPCLRAGFVQFSYGAGLGPLQPINWSQSIFFPEFQGATGFNVFVPPNLNWTAWTTDEPPNAISAKTVSGILNFTIGQIAGLTPGSITANVGSTFGASAIFRIPYVAASRTLTNVLTKASQAMTKVLDNAHSIRHWAAAVAFASEIAQHACEYNASETTEPFTPSTSSYLATPTMGVPRNAVLEIIGTPVGPQNYFGSRGIPLLGKFAWDYNGYKTPAQNVNALKTFTAPPFPGATAFYMSLHQPLLANITLGVNEYMLSSIQTDLGELNFLAGILHGIGL